MKTLIVIYLVVIEISVAEDTSKKFVGKNNCDAQFNSANNAYGVRVDRERQLYLAVYQFKDSELVTIFNLQNPARADRKRCGVIRDAVSVQDPRASVIWDCEDRRAESTVVIGTWPQQHPKPYGPATEAWRIDLQESKFVPIKEAGRWVQCRPRSDAGNDDGNGLSDWAKARSKRKSVKP